MAEDRGLRAMLAHYQQVYRERRYAVLLVILSVLLALTPMLFGFGLSAGWFDGLVAIVLLASIHSLCFDNRQRTFALVLGIITIFFNLAGQALAGTASFLVLLIGHLCAVAFFFGAAGLIIRSLFSARSLNFDSIYGAICGYLFVGLAWAMSYSMLESFQPGSFEIGESFRQGDGQNSAYILLYYSFVTLTTVGYGDITPISPTARTFAWIEAISGQFYLAIIVAGLVSLLVARARDPVEVQS